MIGASKSIWDFDPRTVPGCSLWLDASDSSTITLSSGNMTQWRDKSDKGNTMTPFSTFSNATVTSNFQNGLNVLNFSGAGVYQSAVASGVYPIDLYMILALKDTTTHVDVVSVISANSGSTFNSLSFGEYTASRWHNGSDGYARTPNTVAPSNETSTSLLLMNWSVSNNNFIIRRFGTQINQTSSYTYTFPLDSRFQVGYRINPLVFSPATTAGPFRGYIGEIVAFNRQLGSTEREQVEGFLAWKWNISPFYNKNLPTTISGCELWFDGSDYTTMFQNVEGTTAVTAGSQSVARWNDKIRNISVSNTGTFGQSLLAPTSISGGGIFFNNTSSTISSSARGLGTSLTGATSQSAFLLRMPTKYMTLIVASYPLSNDALRQICAFQTNPIGSTVPNFFLGPQMGSQEGGTMLYDYNGSSWGQIATSSSGYNASAILRVDTMASDITPFWSTNGISNTFTTTNNYSTTNTNYPINIIGMGGYSSTFVGSRNFHGNIYEILLYSKILSTIERQQVEGYLARKWNIAAAYSRLPTTNQFYSIRPRLRTFQPTDVPGCVVWLDAGDRTTLTLSGTNVTAWRDKSGFSNSVTQISTTQPTYNSSDSSITFTATSSTFLRGTLSASYSNASVFIVVSVSSNPAGPNNGFPRLSILSDSANANSGLIGQLLIVNGVNTSLASYLSTSTDPTGQGTNFQTFISNVTYNTKQLITHSTTYSGSSFTISTLLNGNTQTNSSRSGTLSVSGGNVGTYNKYSMGNYPDASTSGGDAYHGKIFEYLVFNTALSTQERQQVEGYLGNKWGISLEYQILNPLSVAGCTMWLDGADPAGTGTPPSAGTLSTWVDKSGNGRNGVQYSTFARPTFVTNSLNSKGGVSFTAASSNCYQTQSVLPTPRTMFIVGFSSNDGMVLSGIPNPNSGHPPYYASFARDVEFGVNNTSDSAFSANVATSSNVNYIITGLYTTSNVMVLVNGGVLSTSLAFTGTPKTPSTTLIGINSYAGSLSAALGGTINEFITYSVDLTSDQRQSVERYLAKKWGIALSTTVGSAHSFYRFRPSAALPFLPTNINGLSVWFDAADRSTITGSNPVTAWRDKSSNAWNATTLIGTAPTTTTVNGLNAVSFASSSVLTVSNVTFSSIQPRAIFIVYRVVTSTPNYISFFSTQGGGLNNQGGYNNLSYSTGGGAFLQSYSAGGVKIINTALTPNTLGTTAQIAYIHSATSTANNFITQNGTSYTLNVDGNDLASGYGSGTVTYYIGNAYPNPYILCEYIMYQGEFTVAQRQQVEGYLAWKWGIMSSLPNTHSYRRFEPPQKSLVVPSTIATVTLSSLSSTSGTITWTISTDAVGYFWYVGTAAGSGQVATGTITSGATLTTSVSFSFVSSTSYFAWVIPYSSTGTNGATTISPSASYTSGGSSVIVTTNLIVNLDPVSYTASSTSWPATVGNTWSFNSAPTIVSTTTSVALSFNGSQYVMDQTGFTTGPASSSSFTIEVWFYAAANLTNNIMSEMGQSGGPGGGWNVSMMYIAGNIVYAAFWVGGVHTLSLGSYSANTWTQACYTYSGTTVTGYRNGVSVSSNSATKQYPGRGYYCLAGAGNPIYSSTACRIGGCRIYSSVLSAAQVTQNYNAYAPRFGLSTI